MNSSDIDFKYEFDAPKYVDFLAPENFDDNADEWFEHHNEDDVEFGSNEIPEEFDVKPVIREERTSSNKPGRVSKTQNTNRPPAQVKKPKEKPQLVPEVKAEKIPVNAEIKKKQAEPAPAPESSAAASVTESQPQGGVTVQDVEQTKPAKPAPVPESSVAASVTESQPQAGITVEDVEQTKPAELALVPESSATASVTESQPQGGVTVENVEQTKPVTAEPAPVPESSVAASMTQSQPQVGVTVQDDEQPKQAEPAPATASLTESQPQVGGTLEDVKQPKQDETKQPMQEETTTMDEDEMTTMEEGGTTKTNDEATTTTDEDEVPHSNTQLGSEKATSVQNAKPDLEHTDTADKVSTVSTLKTEAMDTSEPCEKPEDITRRVTRSVSALQRQSKQRRSARLQRRSNVVIGSPAQQARKRRRSADQKPSKQFLSIPTTPTVLKRHFTKVGSELKSHEQMELEKVTEYRTMMEKQRQQSQKSYEKMQSSKSYTPVRSTQMLTKPTEFKFQTDSRIKGHCTDNKEEMHPDCFFNGLRNSAYPCKTKHTTGPTVPRPFNLTVSRKRKVEPDNIPRNFKTMALQIAEFSSKTPERFRTKPRQEQNRGPLPLKVERSRITVPLTPNLECRKRTRPVTVLSAVEKEDLQVEKMKEFKFKAQPIDPRVMDEPDLIAPHSKDITVPIGFHLEIERRIKERHEQKSKEEEKQKTKEETHMIKAKPIVHAGVPFRPLLDHKRTEVKAFSFDTRDKDCLAKKEAKIQEVYRKEDEARKFKAQPLPDVEGGMFQPEKNQKVATRPEPFSFEARGAKQAEKWLQQVQEELQEQRSQASRFKARPADVLYNKPFIPERSNKPLTDVSEFHLNTASRATERSDYDKKKWEVEMQREEALRRQNELQVEEEKREIAQMRAEATHKARPIGVYKSVVIRPSDKALTVPESPAFTDRRRSRLNDS